MFFYSFRGCRGSKTSTGLGEDDDRVQGAWYVPSRSPLIRALGAEAKSFNLLSTDKIRTSTLVQSQSNLAATHAHHLPFWRETLLQNPSAALLNPEHAHVPTPSPQDRERRQLRDVFWDGVPSIWRAEVWLKLVGNGLALGSRDYDGYVGRFEKAVQEERFPKSTMEDIERDAERCWTGLGMYERGNDRWKALREFLGAWVVVSSFHSFAFILIEA